LSQDAELSNCNSNETIIDALASPNITQGTIPVNWINEFKLIRLAEITRFTSDDSSVIGGT